MLARRIRQTDRSAMAVVELAVVFIILVPLMLGTWEVGRLVEVQQALDNAAREGGRQAATGNVTASSVQQIVVNELAGNGITCATSSVTVTNLTNTSNPSLDPTSASPLDQYQVTVSISFNSVRWILLNQITSVSTLSASAVWVSMKDSPLTVDTNVPAN
jgi:Flp pilus assembly protein TadG